MRAIIVLCGALVAAPGWTTPVQTQMAPDEVRTLVLGADLDTPLVDYRAKGHSVEYLGLEDVEGSPAHKLRVTLKSGDEVTYFIDPDSMMVIRAVEKQLVRGTEKEVETDFGEYERVNGVWEPMSEESGAKGSSANEKERSLFEKAEANVPLNDAVFAFPVAAQATKESAK